MDRTTIGGISAVLGLFIAIGFVIMRGGRRAAPARDEVPSVVSNAAPEDAPPRRSALLATARVVVSATPSTQPAQNADANFDERTLMEQLRELRVSAPLLALQLAREANAKHPASPGASERAWIVVKSLTDLERFDEARTEARIMVDRYRNTEWAEDVYRHVLVHPPGPPERGAEQ